jgi:hemerythrin superfamily protein
MGLFGSSNPVFDMLKKDHAKVKQLFEDFEKTRDNRTKKRIMEETLLELEVHAKVEEKLIYPAIRAKIDADKIMDEALEEHHVAHMLINELKRGQDDNGRHEAKFKVLGESIKHHIKEEEGTLFPEAEKADLDWEALEQKARKQKAALKANNEESGNSIKRAASAKRQRQPRRLRKAA